MERFEYTAFNILFSLAPAILLFFRHRKQIKKYRVFVFVAVRIGICWAIAGDVVGAGWGAWEYTPTKVLGVGLGKGVIETFVWGGILFAIFAAIIIIFAEKEEKKKSFWPFI